MSRWQKPRLLISEQVVCLCTTAVTQTSNTNIFSNSVPQHGAFSPSLCSQQLSQQVAPFTFQQSILFFIFGAKTLPTVEFTAWTLVLILWLSWATHSFTPISPIIPFFLGIPLVFSQNAEMFTPAENPTRQNRAVRNVQTGYEYAPAGKHRLYFIMAPTEVMWSKKIFVQVCDWINKLSGLINWYVQNAISLAFPEWRFPKCSFL